MPGIKKRFLASLNAADDRAQEEAQSSSSIARRGGIAKRARMAQEKGIIDKEPQPLTASLKRDWANGTLSSPKVQEYAMGAMVQGATGTEAMAKVGAHGKNPGHMMRALMSALGKPLETVEITWVDLPVKGSKHPISHPFILPHNLFGAIQKERPDLWRASILHESHDLLDFWDKVKDTPMVQEHPELPHKGFTIPLGFHGDGVAVSKHDSLLTLSWNSLLSGSSVQTLDKRFVTTILKKSTLLDDGRTMEKVWEVIGWSMNCLLRGREPREDYMGRPIKGGEIADGFRGALIQLRGDWEFFSDFFDVARWNNAENCCWLCKASATPGSELRWTCWDADAPWRGTRRTHESWLEELRAEGKEPPALFRTTIGLRLEAVMIDILHCVDQGAASHIIGNILWEVVRMNMWGTTIEQNTEALHSDIKAWYASIKDRSPLQGKLIPERLRTSGQWPKLKAKAACTRHLASYAVNVATRFNSGSPHDQRKLALAKLLEQFYSIVASEDMFLSETAKRELPRMGRQMMGLYSALSIEAAGKHERLWKMTPKFHCFQHLMEWQSVEVCNPRFYWVYADEDLMGHISEIAQSTHVRTMHEVVMYKWMLLAFDCR